MADNEVVDGPPPDEVHIALVRPLGVNTDAICEHLQAAFGVYGFAAERVRLSEAIANLRPYQGSTRSYDYYVDRMDAGDDLRDVYGGAILAMLAVRKVIKLRDAGLPEDKRGFAFIYDSVMHPAEIELLRQTYGELVFVVSINSSEQRRSDRLRQRLLSARTSNREVDERVRELLARDLGRNRKRSGGDLSFEATFHLADVFVDGSIETADIEPNKVGDEENKDAGHSTHRVIRRFLQQLFSFPHGIPTVEESGMALAASAQLRSSCLARRVGAAITTHDGDILALGRNDVPQPHGGLYDATRPDTQGDANYKYHADSFPVLDEDAVGADSNDLVKLEMLRDLILSAIDSGVVSLPEGDDADDEAAHRKLLASLLASAEVRGSQFFELIAYGRTVHAEMDAITSAARRGTSIRGSVLFTTTFPCHECGRHIVASGISTVVYVEPYPKSRVAQLHNDAVDLVVDEASLEISESPRVVFRPFVGIAPRRLAQLFSFEPRKNNDPTKLDKYGLALPWEISDSAPLRQSILGPIHINVRKDAERAIVRATDPVLIAEGLDPDGFDDGAT
jgi:deoxycytidylate deaminase